MKICISMLCYAISAYGEYIFRACKRAGYDVKVVGPYHALNMPYNGGMIVSEKYDFRPDIVLPSSSNVPIGFVESQLGEWKPDLWLEVNAGFWLDGRPKHGKKIHIQTDSHVLRNLYDSLNHQYDKVFNPQSPYMRPGEFYLPYGYDPEWHAPIENVEKEWDVVCVGNIYENRVRLFSRLMSEGIRGNLKLGIAKDDAKLLYNQSIMGLNWSSLLDTTARVFEITAMGIVPILNRVPDLPRFFDEDKDYLGFSNEDEAVEKIKWVLANPDKGDEIARNARKKAVEGKNSWDDRLETIIQESFRV